MKYNVLLLFGYFLFSCLSPDEGSTCTTFVLGDKDNQVFGRNYDWDVEDGLVIVNKRGVLKSGYPRDDEKGTLAVWTSRYGSVTFNQYGRELPTGGMNEAGLVVETMALSEARYPSPDNRPYLGSALQWRQFLLDNFALVNEVIGSDTIVRISPRRTGLGIHVLISDRTGNCASIEFIDGKMKIHFRTRMNSKMRVIDMTRLDYACQTPVQLIDINAQLSGDVTDRFENYTSHKNRALIENSFRKTSFLRNTPKAALDRLSDFPETMKCRP